MLWYVEDEDEDGDDDDDDDDDDEDEALTSLTRSMTELAAGSRDAFARVGIVEIDDISAMQFYPTVGSANAWLILIEHFQKIRQSFWLHCCGQSLEYFGMHESIVQCPFGKNRVIEGPVWYTIYHHLPVVEGVNKPLY